MADDNNQQKSLSGAGDCAGMKEHVPTTTLDSVDEASRDVSLQRVEPPLVARQQRIRAGQRGGARRGLGRRRLSLAPLRFDVDKNVSPVTVENVEHDTEHVVNSFMAHSYERQQSCLDEELEGAAAAAARPEAPHSFQMPPQNSQYAGIGRKLACIGDDIDRRYRGQFDSLINELRLKPSTTYEAFAALAERVLENDFNWGRVVTLLCFGFRMAMRSLQTGLTEFVGKIIKYLTQFIITSRLSQWIAQNGGWNAVRVVVEGANTSTVVTVAAVALLSMLATWYFSRK